jgi:hypothetical protein
MKPPAILIMAFCAISLRAQITVIDEFSDGNFILRGGIDGPNASVVSTGTMAGGARKVNFDPDPGYSGTPVNTEVNVNVGGLDFTRNDPISLVISYGDYIDPSYSLHLDLSNQELRFALPAVAVNSPLQLSATLRDGLGNTSPSPMGTVLISATGQYVIPISESGGSGSIDPHDITGIMLTMSAANNGGWALDTISYAPVPEPTCCLPFGIGLLAFGLIYRTGKSMPKQM